MGKDKAVVNVFFIRPGQSTAEVVQATESADAPKDEETSNDETEKPKEQTPTKKKGLPRLCQLYQPAKMMLEGIMKRLDPDLSDEGFVQSENIFRALGDTFRETGDVRRIAYFTAPYKRCVSTSTMVCISGFEPEDWSVWGLSTPDTASAPTAIPITVVDELADCTQEIKDLGGLEDTVNAGLLLCSASPWNKAYKKDPIAGHVLDLKDRQKDRLLEWQLQGEALGSRIVTDLQFLRLPNRSDPYTMAPMTEKFSLTLEKIRPNLIMDPPRRGEYQSKPSPPPPSVGQEGLDTLVNIALNAGCDTVIAVVPPEIIDELCKRTKQDDYEGNPGPATVSSFLARAKKDGRIKWSYQCTADATTMDPSRLPKFDGPIEPRIQPPEEFKAAMEKAGEERWSLFPPPPKENIHPNYPTDIPSFSLCLAEPEPIDKKWAWQSNVKEPEPEKPSPKQKKRGKVVMKKPNEK